MNETIAYEFLQDGVYLRRVTQTESEHKTRWTAATWLATLSLVATFEHKNIVWQLTVFVSSKKRYIWPCSDWFTVVNVSIVGSFESVVFENWHRKLNLEMVASAEEKDVILTLVLITMSVFVYITASPCRSVYFWSNPFLWLDVDQ